jgi:hypothetical protein
MIRFKRKVISLLFLVFLHIFAAQSLVFANISGVIRVGAGMQYTSLTKWNGLFAAINGNIVSGNIIAMICTNVEESGQVKLNQWTESGSGNYKLFIVPCDTATVVKQISGTYNNSTSGLYRFDGADRLIIDGNLNGAGRFLRFTALGNMNGSIFYFSNGACHDTIRNVIVEAGVSAASVTAISFKSPIDGGNSYNGISGNVFRGNPDVPGSFMDAAIVSGATFDTITWNRRNTILNNEISNIKWNAIAIYGGLYWNVQGNSIFNNVISTFTNHFTGIETENSGGHLISGNFIGGTALFCGGTKWISIHSEFYAIKVGGSAIPETIENNTISNIQLSGCQKALMIYLGTYPNMTRVSGNIIGSENDTTSIILSSVYSFAGIYLYYTSGATVREISGNTISGVIAPDSSYGLFFQGIHIENIADQVDTLKVINNHIHHLYSRMMTYNALPVFCGIGDYSTMTKRKYSGNSIHDLYNTAAGNINNSVTGILLRNYTGSGILEKNKIYRLYNSLENSYVQGIYIFGGNFIVRNNFISLSNDLFSQQINLYGINAPGNGGVNLQAYGNSVRLFGMNNSAQFKSVCFNAVTSGSVSCRNNIFSNACVSQGKKNVLYCSNSISYTGDHNAFYTTGPEFGVINGYSYSDLQQWTSISSQDSNSFVYKAVFQDHENGDLHLSLPADTILNNKGTPVAGLIDDFDGQTRPVDHPDIGADEILFSKIYGKLYYLNVDSSGLSNCKLYLINDIDQVVDSSTTDSIGNFYFFDALPGYYHLKVMCNKTWGGVNPGDALSVLKHFVGNTSLSGMYLEAAKVSNDEMVNSLDALLICRRFVGLITEFSKSDWIFGITPFYFTNSNIFVSIPALCLGDINASYVP